MAGVGASAPAVDPPKSTGFGRRYGEVVQTTDSSTGTKVTIKPPGAATPTRSERRAAVAEPASVATTVVDVQAETVAADAGVGAAAPAPAAKKPRKKKGGGKKKK
eukprot:5531650-Prymnesium_polylepis.1